METRTALVLGTSGPVGRHCLSELVRDPRYERIVSVDWKPLEHTPSRVRHHVADTDGWWERHADVLQGHDVFCCPHATMRDADDEAALYQMGCTCPSKAARLALKNGARAYLFVSSLEADDESPFLFLRMKGQVEAFLQTLGYESVHFFRAPLVVEAKGGAPRPSLSEALESVSYAFVGALREEPPIAAHALGRAMVRAARRTPAGIHTHGPTAIRRLSGGGEVSPGPPRAPTPDPSRSTAP